MKAVIVSLTLLLLLCTQAVYSQSGWKWISPYPHGNPIYSIAAAGQNTYFLASRNTVSVSRDSGKTVENLVLYTKTSDYEGGQHSMAFTDSLNGFLLNPDQGEFRTTDGGRSWKQTFRTGFYDVTFADSKTGWEIGNTFATGEANFFKTTDGGNSWNKQTAPSMNWDEYISSFYALDSLNMWITSTTYYGYTFKRLYYSSNGGKNWRPQTTWLPNDTSKPIGQTSLKINKSGLGILAASFYDKSNPDVWAPRTIILRTVDFGNSWTWVDSSAEGSLSSIISVNDSIWILHGNGENGDNMTVQYRSTDFGKSFSGGKLLTPEYSNAFFETSAYNPLQKVIFLSTYNDLYRSLDFGKTYSKVTSENADIYFDFALDDNTSGPQLAAAISTRSDRFLLSEDGGRTWHVELLNLPKNDWGFMKGVEVSGGAINIITFQYMYTSTDKGKHWAQIKYPSYPKIQLSAYSSYNYLALSDVYSQSPNYNPTLGYSSDRGLTWKEVPIPPNYKFSKVKLIGPKEIIGCGSYNDSTGSEGFVFSSSNGGSDWRIIQTREAFKNIYRTPDNLGYGFSDKKIYTTEDNWRTIKNVYNFNTSAVIEDVNFADSAHGIMRAENYFYETSDRGKSWHQSGLDMPMSWSIRKLQYNNQGDLLVLGNSGFIIKLSEKGSKSYAGHNENTHKISYELFQNYPNPFNPLTQISFRLAEKGPAELKVFDIIGREVKTLVSEIKDAGTYSVSFNAAELPSGIYIYRLKTGTQTLARKMLLLK